MLHNLVAAAARIHVAQETVLNPYTNDYRPLLFTAVMILSLDTNMCWAVGMLLLNSIFFVALQQTVSDLQKGQNKSIQSTNYVELMPSRLCGMSCIEVCVVFNVMTS